MTINARRRPTVRLTDRWEETTDLSTEPKGGKPPTSTKGGRSRCEIVDQRKEEAEDKPTEEGKKQRGKMRNLEIPNDSDRRERIKIKQSPTEYLKLKT